MALWRFLVVLTACLCLTHSAAFGQDKGERDSFKLVASSNLPGEKCGPRDGYLAYLKGRFDETPIMDGVDDQGAIIELLTSKDGSTWTLLVTWPTGVSCLLANGTNWQPVQKPGAPT